MMAPRPPKDAAVYAWVAARPTERLSITEVARGVGMTPDTVRVIVQESPRLRSRNVCLGWHVVELAAEEEKVRP